MVVSNQTLRKRGLKVNQLLLKPEEAAEVIRVGRSKMYELLASGRSDP
jgi:hypothetical protein